MTTFLTIQFLFVLVAVISGDMLIEQGDSRDTRTVLWVWFLSPLVIAGLFAFSPGLSPS